MSIGEKLTTIADNRPKLYAKGASDFGTHFDVSGTNLVTIDKVHPKEHDVEVLTDAESVTACGKNLLNIDALTPAQSGRIEPVKNADGSYTLTKGVEHRRITNVVPFNFVIPKGTTVTFSVRFLERQNVAEGDMCFYLNGFEIRTWAHDIDADGVYKRTVTLDRDVSQWYISMVYAPEAGMTFTFDKLQLEYGNTMTEYEEFKGNSYPAEDGKAIVKSVSPLMNITTPTSGASIEAKGYLDGQAVIDELTQAIVNVGGEI